MRDVLPTGVTVQSIVAPGWTCGLLSVILTCTTNAPLAAGSSYPPITVRVGVRTGGTLLTSVAVVFGGGEVVTGNDLAIDLVRTLR
jgi:hypothetical protein